MAGEDANGQREKRSRRVRARDLLRGALVSDEDPRLPWWLPLPGLSLAVGWAAYEGVVGGGMSEFLDTLLWPGGGLLVLVTVASFFGWQLDID